LYIRKQCSTEDNANYTSPSFYYLVGLGQQKIRTKYYLTLNELYLWFLSCTIKQRRENWLLPLCLEFCYSTHSIQNLQ